jgi:putative transposase
VSRGTRVQITAKVFDMVKMVMRVYKYRFYPTPEQAADLCRTFGCVRKVWNLALAARTTAWHQRHERMTYGQSSALLTQWKRSEDLTFLAEVSSVPLQQALRHLQTAYTRYWAKQARHPRFKSRKKSRAAAEYTRSGFRYRDGQLHLAKMTGPLAVTWSRPLPAGAEPSTVTVSRDAAWRQLRAMLEYKCDWYGRDMVVVDRWYPSSKTCSGCGRLAACLPLEVREWECAHCGTRHDRDFNAAVNIRAAGLAVLACGASVRPARELSRAGSRP